MKLIFIHKGFKITTSELLFSETEESLLKQWACIDSSFSYIVYRERGEVTAKEAKEFILDAFVSSFGEIV
jgi:hypothetical protein